MMYTITNNKDFGSIEISFDCKPSEALREALKSLRFRWHSVKKVWYGYKTEEEVKKAIESLEMVENGNTEEKTESKPKQAKKQAGTEQNYIKIYYNGIKINGGKLIKCCYSLDNNKDHSPEICVYCHGYGSQLPRDLFEVHNDTDLYTDYFDTDSTRLTPDNPLFKYFYYAGLKERATSAKRCITNLKKKLEQPERWQGQHEYYKSDIQTQQKYIDTFEKATDPGQPTQEDLDTINRINQEKENNRIQAQHEEELKERERLLNARCNGRRFIAEQMEKYPVKDGEPVVLVHWSEHIALGSYEENTLNLSVTAAENILSTFDKEIHTENRGYDKTKFTITAPQENGEPITYTGRYDLGDNDGGLIQHIRSLAEWDLTHDQYGNIKIKPDETNDRLQFAYYLKTFIKNEEV